LLAEVAGESNDQLEDWCRRLVEAGLASQHGTLDDTTYVFKHALVQEAAYNTLLKPRRRELHTRAAKAIEKFWPQMLEANPEVVAEHFSHGGELKRATELWLVAGRLSAQRTAYKEAIIHLTRVLDTTAKQPQSKEWLSHELAAWVVLGPVLMATEGPASPGPKKAYRKAREISAALNNGEQHFRATYGIWQLTNVGGQHTEAREIAEELIAASKADGDDHHTLQAHHATWSTTFSQGDFDTCRSHLAIGRSMYDEETHREHKFIYGGHDPGVCSRLFSAVTASVVGEWDLARKRADECLALAERLQHPFSNSTAHFGAAMAMYFIGQAVEAERTARLGLELSTSYGLKGWMPFLDLIADSSRAQMMRDEELDGVVRSIQEAFRRWTDSGAGVFNCWYLWELSKLEERGKRLDKAMAHVESARHWAEANGEGWLLAEILRTQGRLEAKMGSPADKVRKILEASQSTAIGQGANCFGLRSTIDLSRFYLSHGDRESGKECLKTFWDGLPDGFDTSDLKEAKALLEELS
jgi:tetratricopeptide (TPR) repeat protein